MLSKNMAKIMNFYTSSGGITIKTTIEIEKKILFYMYENKKENHDLEDK